jgi:protein SDA1
MIASVRKQQIKAEGNDGEARFAAMQLIDDPQGFAEMLFKKLKEGAQAFETKMLLLQVVSRVVGLHQLILLNFYPFLQRYIQPNQRDVRFVYSKTFLPRERARVRACLFVSWRMKQKIRRSAFIT